VVKGNESEIRAVFAIAKQSQDNSAQQRGVDSHGTLTDAEKAKMVQELAEELGAIVLMTGTTDYVGDREMVFAIANGHKLLGNVTGTGCVLGTTISAFVAAFPDTLVAVIAGILVFEIAAERAAARPEVRGPGTFVPAFLDELYLVRQETVSGDTAWRRQARLSRVI